MRPRYTPRIAGPAIVWLTVVCMGCGESVPSAGRLAISGEVQMDGKPLDEGYIHFEPVQGKLDSGAVIKQGKYSIPADKGLPPGKFLVSISSPTKDTRSADEIMKGGEPFVSAERIAAKYNTESTTGVDVVKGTNKFDFKVESAPPPM